MIGVVTVAVLISVPLWADQSTSRTLVSLLTLIALAQMWSLLAGYAGLMSVGQQGYIGVGAYSLWLLTDVFGVHPFLAVPLTGVFAAVISLPTAALVFRLKGSYFAIGTWVMAEMLRLIVANIPQTGGGSGKTITAVAIFIVVIGGVGTIEGPILGAIIYFVLQETLSSYGSWYLILLGVLAVVITVWFPGGLWGTLVNRWSMRLFPVQRRLRLGKVEDSGMSAETANGPEGVGAKMRVLRQAKKMSLRALARKVDVTPSLISQIETGKINPSVASLYAIANALEAPMDAFFGRDLPQGPGARPTGAAPTSTSMRRKASAPVARLVAGGVPRRCSEPVRRRVPSGWS